MVSARNTHPSNIFVVHFFIDTSKVKQTFAAPTYHIGSKLIRTPHTSGRHLCSKGEIQSN